MARASGAYAAVRAASRKAAPKIAEKVSKAIKSGKKGYRQAGEIARREASRARKEAVPPELNDYSKRTAKLVAQVTTGSELMRRLDRIEGYKEHLSGAARKALYTNLDVLSREAKKRADGFRFVAVPKSRRLTG